MEDAVAAGNMEHDLRTGPAQGRRRLSSGEESEEGEEEGEEEEEEEEDEEEEDEEEEDEEEEEEEEDEEDEQDHETEEADDDAQARVEQQASGGMQLQADRPRSNPTVSFMANIHIPALKLTISASQSKATPSGKSQDQVQPSASQGKATPSGKSRDQV
jgi:archaellum component FlaD/FlaE